MPAILIGDSEVYLHTIFLHSETVMYDRDTTQNLVSLYYIISTINYKHIYKTEGTVRVTIISSSELLTNKSQLQA